MAQRPKKEFEDSSEEENEDFKNLLFSEKMMQFINATDSEEEEEPSTSHKRKKKRRRKSSSEDAEQQDGPSTSRKRKKKRRKKSKSRHRARMPVEDPEIDEPFRNDTSSGGLSPWAPVLEPSAEKISVPCVDLNGEVPPFEAECPGSSKAIQEKSEPPPSKAMECEMSDESSSKVGEDPTNPTYLPRGQDPEDPEIDEPFRNDTSSGGLSPCAPVLEPSANIQVVDFNGVVEPSEAEGPGSSMASQEKSESPPSKAMECVMSEASSSKVGEDPTNPTCLPRGQGNDQSVI
ncbi:uncharacterized protein DDB_G0283697-like [Drosophila subpulchrella]|uniref:uncharacterized protein DDB_G0283697-like n=1 Tax=Drosophila subpulchrella TaxID=1486046 RepID=UPI0018A151C8|nr:uncharacterized protein DDB_G0283697-like [Drosophila subpulchrella]